MMENVKLRRTLTTLACVLVSGFIQGYTIQVFMAPTKLVASGFTGVAMLLNALTEYTAHPISISLGIVLLNVPTAFMCYKNIGPRFTFYSLLQVMISSVVLKLFYFEPLFQDAILNVIFGGVANAFAAVLALKGNASTGGTDFIALYFSNRYNKSFWDYVFGFNALIIIIFGFTQGWLYAGYSIVFQFICTKTIQTFHTRYDRLTVQIITQETEAVLEAYTKNFLHGITCTDSYGGYSRRPFTTMITVVSSYEVDDVIRKVSDADPNVIINTFKTENFVGGFYIPPMD